MLEEPWWGAAVLAAALGAIGFLAKSVWDAALAFFDRQRERRAELVQLYSLLQATRYSFNVQREHVFALANKLRPAGEVGSPKSVKLGYEQLFVDSYKRLTPAEKELHDIIRGITVHSLNPTNRAILQWLRDDQYFKASRRGSDRPLADLLSKLEIHLLLWVAKYEVWMAAPEHALVYLADEKKHGVGFPRGIEEVIRLRLGLPETDAEPTVKPETQATR